MRLKQHTIVLMMAITSLWGCAPTEEEKKQAEEEERNKPSLSIQPVGPLVEPDKGFASYSATIIMSKTIDDNVTVHYSLNPKTATGDDFQTESGILTIPSGSNSASIELTILADDIDEQDEEFTIVLSSPVNAKLGIASQVVVIQDSALDVMPVISIEPVDVLTEPDSDSTKFSAIVKLSSFSSFPVTVDYSLDSGSAIAESDFEATSGTLLFEPGTNSAEIDLVIYADDIDEVDEYFTITLDNENNATVDEKTLEVTIVDSPSDIATVSFVTGSARVAESLGEYKVKLILSHASEKEVSIPFTTTGLATEVLDYNIVTKSPILVPVNTKEVDIILVFLADDISEGGESLILQLGTPDNAELREKNTFTFTIAADVTLNDTGITTWYDGLNFAAESPTSLYPGQDADFGRDTENNDNFDGSAGFSFTNLDHSGNVLQPGDSSARCVQDNRTGLVFELKQSQQLLLPTSGGETLRKELQDEIDAGNDPYNLAHANWQASNFQYYWYNDDNTTNGGSTGAPGGAFVIPTYPVSRTCAFPNENMENYNSDNTACNTLVYANALNSSSFCGFKDWKLPTVEQLRTIHNYRDTTSVINGTEFFTNTEVGYYISSTPSADGSGAIWCMSGSTGQVAFCNKNLPNYVRMVRGGAQ
ncbi:MAG: hypothetical protein COA76_03060 [Moritella sp.]|nr:MAG: hypothetical protein COA76_03060 [Moritella sp.]